MSLIDELQADNEKLLERAMEAANRPDVCPHEVLGLVIEMLVHNVVLIKRLHRCAVFDHVSMLLDQKKLV